MQLTEILIGGGFLLLIAVPLGVIGYLYVGLFKRISSVARWKNLVWRHPYSPNHGAVLDEQVVQVEFSMDGVRLTLFLVPYFEQLLSTHILVVKLKYAKKELY